ncbi:MAG: hypothetical protein NTX25_24035, partial [Proteobacteria bacterium]|nr:hypothetical protein [Pseudomonadota bacterium]
MKTLPSLKNLKKPSCSIFSAIFLFGCGLTSPKIQPHGISSLSSSSSDFDPRIGEAYDQVTDQFLGSSCVSFPSEIGASVEFIPPKIGELNIDQDASFESLSKALSGGGQISLNLDSFKGSGSLEFANEMQSDSYSKTLAVYFNVEQGELALKQQEGLVNLNSLGKNWITSNDETQRRKKCGTVFVGRKKLAANFVAVLKFEFANKGRRDSFAGNVNINVSGFQGEANIKSAIAAASSDAKITLKVRQIGGDATKLTTLASENIAKCSTSDRAACDSAVKSIFDYVKDFSKQFADTDGKPLPERYMTVANDYRSYDSVDAQWTGKPLSPEEAAKLELDRRAFGEKMSDELANYNRASGLVDSGMSLSALELQDIRAIQDIIRNRFQVYADAAQTCYTETWATCAAANKNADSDIKNNPELAYDITKLVIIPADMIGWCAKLNQYGKVLALDPGALAVANT